MLHGKVDFMLAQGRQEPRQPFFCLQEYKQENRRDNDPRGQLLAAMVAAQANNVPDLPIYGAYVSGRNWFFVLLEGTEYTVSPAYDAAQEDVFQVFAILSECKNEIVALSKKLLPTGK